VAGLYVQRTASRDALVAIAAGVGGMLVVEFATAGRGWGALTPALAGLLAAFTAWLGSLAFAPRPVHAAAGWPAEASRYRKP